MSLQRRQTCAEDGSAARGRAKRAPQLGAVPGVTIQKCLPGDPAGSAEKAVEAG